MKSLKYLLFIVLFYSCETDENSIQSFENLNDSIKIKYAPDKRVAIYNVSLEEKGDVLVLKGETDNAAAIEELRKVIATKGSKFEDKVTVLPDAVVGDEKYAIANNSVCNLRGNAKHSAELATQVVLGTKLKVLKKEGSFTLVQTPEKYIAWVDNGGIQLVNKKKLEEWLDSGLVIYSKTTGNLYQDKDFTIILADIVLGGKVKLKEELTNSYKIQLPDGRIGFVKKVEAQIYSSWLENLNPSQEGIENYAKSLLGSPYLWGGTSSKAVDCSGFVKTVYLMNGFVTPRDASQQIFAGKIVDENLKFEGLEKGDLLFFGSKATEIKKQRVTHVGIWLGNGKKEFIHSSGRVKLNSVDSSSNIYDEGNVNRYLGSRRYLGVEDSLIIDLKKL